jgi:hypothetical protein
LKKELKKGGNSFVHFMIRKVVLAPKDLRKRLKYLRGLK